MLWTLPARDRPLCLLFSGFPVNTDQLIVESTDTASQWTMFSEVKFFGTVPEPSTSLLALLAGVFLIHRRRS
jgi:hypothetical protein